MWRRHRRCVTDRFDLTIRLIHSAVKRGLADEEWRSICRSTVNPYGVGDAGKKIAKVLLETPLDHRLLRKRMTLKGEARDGWYR